MTAGLIAAIAVVVALGSWGIFESQWVRVGTREVRVAGLPPALEGFRVLHVSDLHFGAVSLAWLGARRAAAWAAGRDPDLTVITGDLLSARRG